MTRDPQEAASVGDHNVVLYDDDQQFVRAVGEYASDALADGGSVVLLATDAQRDAAEEWLHLSRSTTEGAESPGRYVVIDADAVADELVAAAEPARVFEELLSRACADIGTPPTTVHIFGSLVGALWERGKPDIVTSIEALGSRLADEGDASILCAYGSSAVSNDQGASIVESCHNKVVRLPPARQSALRRGPGDATHADAEAATARIFPPALSACRAARHYVRDILESAESNEVVIDAIELICSELSANAVRHAHSVFTVELECAPTHVRIAVADESPSTADEGNSFPVRTGRGLGIVAALAREWGIEQDETGYAVWAEVAEGDAEATGTSTASTGQIMSFPPRSRESCAFGAPGPPSSDYGERITEV
ncbi:MAG: ATP-binding protein [Acidimicrobiales bacterium]